MATAVVESTKETPKEWRSYLGYQIEAVAGIFVATSQGWSGPSFLGMTLPSLRRQIWRWWHQVN